MVGSLRFDPRPFFPIVLPPPSSTHIALVSAAFLLVFCFLHITLFHKYQAGLKGAGPKSISDNEKAEEGKELAHHHHLMQRTLFEIRFEQLIEKVFI
ncbi:hypothetical protein NPIL_479451 [Nephila pilipes]|uniref:Uncharacterized protein n=1 Tax=Nephila pilipes TaxID=299642 RepID=A0A8X6MBQ4_NEPPI|nr:hypothetical protein NPIL_479451 [Nephila pilipes]